MLIIYYLLLLLSYSHYGNLNKFILTNIPLNNNNYIMIIIKI